MITPRTPRFPLPDPDRRAFPATAGLHGKLSAKQPLTLSGVFAGMAVLALVWAGVLVGTLYGFSIRAGVNAAVALILVGSLLWVAGLHVWARRKFARMSPETRAAVSAEQGRARERKIAKGLASGAITLQDVEAADAEMSLYSEQVKTELLREVANKMLDAPVTSAEEIEVLLLAVVPPDQSGNPLASAGIGAVLDGIPWRPGFGGLLTPNEFEAMKARIRTGMAA